MAVVPAFGFSVRRGRVVDAQIAIRAPRSVAVGSPACTRREAAALRQLEVAYRELYTNALPELETGKPIVIGITSAIRGEGRTTTALGLSLAIARDLDVRVLLAELDLERPSLARHLKLVEQPGLADVLTDAGGIDAAIRPLSPYSVDLLPAGRSTQSVARLLRSQNMRTLLDTARSAFQVTLLDLPPALANSEVVPLSALLDGLLLTVRAGETPARLVQQARDRFPNGMIRGIVLNGHQSKIPTWLRRLF